MSEYDADRFLKSITKSKPVLPALKEAAPPMKMAEPKPPEAKVPEPNDKLDESDGLDFLRRNNCFGDDDVRILTFLDACRDGYVTRGNVEDIVTAIKKPIVPEPETLVAKRTTKNDAPKKQEAKPVPVAPTAPTVTPPPPDPDAGLPPLAPWVWKQLGSNKLLTRQDVHAVPSWLYSEIYRGPHAAAFKARVNAVLARK